MKRKQKDDSGGFDRQRSNPPESTFARAPNNNETHVSGRALAPNDGIVKHALRILVSLTANR
ncbi:MAG: hypothetical protein HY015_10530 [Bacteroidetes bacterium]|nr:hypothetical protein [Bacteroidota bacterium]MBI3483384.1 hypothetical protein [Bacteroidota bacterium]